MELRASKGSKVMVDEESGLLYHPPSAKGRWPELAGFTSHSESKGKMVSRCGLPTESESHSGYCLAFFIPYFASGRDLPPLAKMRLLEDIHIVLGSSKSREAVAASFERAAQRAAADDSELDGETLLAPAAVEFLRKK